jgi:hypothetical protein
MITGVINVSEDFQYAYPLGRTSLFWSPLPLKQEVRQGGTKHQLEETHRLLNDMCHLLFLTFNLTMTPKVKHLLKLYGKSALPSPFRYLHLHQIWVL